MRDLKSRYKRKKVKGKSYYVHRLVYEEHHGPIPEGMQIDHINGDRFDNRIENLRLVTPKGNHQNRTTAKGFTYVRPQGKFRAQIMIDDKTLYLGCYDTIVDARAAYLRAKREYHPLAPV